MNNETFRESLEIGDHPDLDEIESKINELTFDIEKMDTQLATTRAEADPNWTHRCRTARNFTRRKLTELHQSRSRIIRRIREETALRNIEKVARLQNEKHKAKLERAKLTREQAETAQAIREKHKRENRARAVAEAKDWLRIFKRLTKAKLTSEEYQSLIEQTNAETNH